MKTNEVPNEVPITMVILPQTVWQETTEKIDKLLQLVDGAQMSDITAQQIRIPLVQFKNDVELQRRYGLTYTIVRKITKNNLLRSYCDPDRQRYRWTTHKDIMDYLTLIKNYGTTINPNR
jgi:hypothetical protein